MSYPKLILGDCADIVPDLCAELTSQGRSVCIVTDPPFNVGYHYKTYNDNKPEEEYYSWLKTIFSNVPKVVIHYPESLYKLSIALQEAPTRVISWVYNCNASRNHRDIAFYGITPDFTKVKQPYKNLNDKRIRQRIAEGCAGASLYDWWEINQIKNVTKAKMKINHPCVMPVEVMTNIIGMLPPDTIIIDPFMGSGTTGIGCKMLGYDFIGVEIDPDYFELANSRINKKIIKKIEKNLVQSTLIDDTGGF